MLDSLVEKANWTSSSIYIHHRLACYAKLESLLLNVSINSSYTCAIICHMVHTSTYSTCTYMHLTTVSHFEVNTPSLLMIQFGFLVYFLNSFSTALTFTEILQYSFSCLECIVHSVQYDSHWSSLHPTTAIQTYKKKAAGSPWILEPFFKAGFLLSYILTFRNSSSSVGNDTCFLVKRYSFNGKSAIANAPKHLASFITGINDPCTWIDSVNE